MGIPVFFKWLSEKVDGVIEYVGNNRNQKIKRRVDNLYIDMNSVIHPSVQPEGCPRPLNESEMFANLFDYMDDILNAAQPQGLLYLAIDGVAPRAKMNQQRVRRLRSSIRKLEEMKDAERCLENMRSSGVVSPENSGFWDTNAITPGTEFMQRLSEQMDFYIHSRLAMPRWSSLAVILSDSSVPGEGEHKIMNFIRKQKNQKNYNPQTSHCIFGPDADLVMLGLATHERHITVLREKFKGNIGQLCSISRPLGRTAKKYCGKRNSPLIASALPKEFLFINLGKVRSYIVQELNQQDPERAIDDWIFLCFLVGNDFLPRLPSLSIRFKGIEKLMSVYKKCDSPGYLTADGEVNLVKLQALLYEIGRFENDLYIHGTQIPLSDDERTLEYDVTLSEPDYKKFYYKNKMSLLSSDVKTRFQLTKEYIKGLVWVFKYYTQGCPSWSWFYPYHYAPLPSDFLYVNAMTVDFDEISKPLSPLCQLMAVLPSYSSKLLPPQLAQLLTNFESPILDFYPSSYVNDLNGNEFDWQGVALIPFIDENRLVQAVKPIVEKLSDGEKKRDQTKNDVLYASAGSNLHMIVKRQRPHQRTWVNTTIKGSIFVENRVDHYRGSYIPPLTSQQSAVNNNQVYRVQFTNPSYPKHWKLTFHNVPSQVRKRKSNEVE